MNSILYGFNRYIEMLAQKLVENTDVDPKGLFDFLVRSAAPTDEESKNSPGNWITTKIPHRLEDNIFDLDSMIKIDFYYLNRSL